MISRFVLGFLFAATAYAGGQGVGNGGHGVSGSCYLNRTVNESLDLYEAKKELGLTIDLGAANLDPYAKVAYALNRLQLKDSDRANLYRTWLATFKDEALFYQNAEILPNINDYGYINIPSGCSVYQIAIQKEPVSPPLEKRYKINGIAFDKFDTNDSRAALILHEIIYRDALDHGHANSVNVRFLNAVIMSTAISTMAQNDYEEILKKKNFIGYSARLGSHGHAQNQTARLFLRPMTFTDAKSFCTSFDPQGDLYAGGAAQTIGYDHDPLNGAALQMRNFKLQRKPAEYLRIWTLDSIQSPTKIYAETFSQGGARFANASFDVPDSSTALALPMCWTPSYNAYGD